MLGTKCPYCGFDVKFSSKSDIIYGRDYGVIYLCSNYPSCDAFVGCHNGTKNSLGRLANKELREKKKIAHYYFDTLWKEKKAFRI